MVIRGMVRRVPRYDLVISIWDMGYQWDIDMGYWIWDVEYGISILSSGI